MAWLSDWRYRIGVSVDSSKIDSNLTDFPLLITLTSGTITDNIFDEVGDNSKKIAVTAISGSEYVQCYTEIERWDAAGKTAYLWAKIPQIDSVEDTSIYLYYDSLQDGSTAYVGGHAKMDTSTGIRLEPDTSPYTATTLMTDADLVDGDRGTAASNWWLSDYSYGIDFGESQTFDEIRVYGVDSGGSPLGTSYLGSDYDTVEVFVSDDNSSWSSVESFDSPTVTQRTDCSYMTLPLSTVQTARYVKVVCTDSENIADSSGSTWYVTEVEAYAGITAAQNVWDSNFVGVWHMNQDPNGDVEDAIKDSTSNGYDLTPDGSMTSTDLVAGKIGDGLDLDSSDDQLYRSTFDDIGTNGITLSIIMGLTGYTQYCRPFSIQYDTGVHPGAAIVDGGSGEITMLWVDTDGSHGNSDSIMANTTFSTDGSFQHITGAWDGTGDDGKIYINGVDDSDTNSGSWSSWNMATGISIGEYNNDPAQGIYDEARISNIERSDAWIKADYHSCFDDLITFGSVESSYYFSGYTQIDGTGIGPRTIYAFRRDNGTFMGSTTSSGNGYFYLPTTYSGSHLIVALDDDAGSDYNDLIFGRVYPATSF